MRKYLVEGSGVEASENQNTSHPITSRGRYVEPTPAQYSWAFEDDDSLSAGHRSANREAESIKNSKMRATNS
jgi:hypothetical protein